LVAGAGVAPPERRENLAPVLPGILAVLAQGFAADLNAIGIIEP
jgi:hypothetical protein